LLTSALKIIIIGTIVGLAFPLFSLDAADQPLTNSVIHHNLTVALFPGEHRFTAEDTITIPDHSPREVRFMLHEGLNPVSRSQGVLIMKDSETLLQASLDTYRVELPQGVNTFVISFGGTIDHPLEQIGKEQARGYSQTMGKISGEGVYLSGHSHWYPVFDGSMLTFSLTVELPGGWEAVSQGERSIHLKDQGKTSVRWSSPEPQEEIFLVAAQFHEYTRPAVHFQAMVFLRSPDQALAEKYLNATVRYVSMYETLIGPYPYKKFALVENFWETGFGMPSFTLLGSKVIRFPFIINTSYPHEILHTWWGNSVFPDYEQGNWAEGLTAYLSDHLNAEQRGADREYRQTTLQKYSDYVSGGKDFPLTEFRSRHSASTEAIGYGKSLMFFHMLRLEMGDDVFIRGLQEFYSKNRFHYASFHDLRKSFESVTGGNLEDMFKQWITQAGAPALETGEVKVHAVNDAYVLTATIKQVQKENPYHFLLPVAITMENQEQAYQTSLRIDRQRFEMKITLPKRPLRIDFDPDFDVFRRLDRKEIPPAITQVLGAKKLLVILPSSAKPSLHEVYRTFAEVLRNAGPDHVEVKPDREISEFPADSAICILGRENRFSEKAWKEFARYGLQSDQEKMRLMQSSIPFAGHSIVLTGRNPANQHAGMLFIASDGTEALRGLSRKLPHYHKYSYLVFKGDEPENIAKGRWPVADSPMTVFLPDENGYLSKAEMGGLKRKKPLASVSQDFSPERMMRTVRFLAGDELKGRALGSQDLDLAADYIARQFLEAGLRPAGDTKDSYFQTWVEREQDGKQRVMKNIIGVVPGRKPEWSSQSIVVGAHYDHLGTLASREEKEQIYYGADDNASGVAVMLELARLLGEAPAPGRSIIFVAFTGEESGRGGSKYFLDHLQDYPKSKMMGMLNLDTVGRLGNNNLLILGSGSAKEWEHIFKGVGFMTGVGIRLVSEELDSSDQKSFQEAGIPAVQLFSGPHPDYHKPSDTAEKIDGAGLVKVASVAKEVIGYLAERQEPLTVSITSDQKPASDLKQERKVSFGIIPDFGYQGSGCRVSGVVQGSPAERAGLREGDIITGFNAQVVNKLKDFSDILKALNPGDTVTLTFLREGREMKAEGAVIEKQ
jgi:hypothetical protein